MPLSGQIFLIRYIKDATLLRESIQYSATQSLALVKTPITFSDLINVKNSFLEWHIGN